MIIFSQGPTSHNRLGNSITWYKDVYPILSDNNIRFYFPWARERQIEYLGSKSVWIRNFVKAQMLFEKSFRKSLNSKTLSDESRLIEDKYEKRNKLSAFQWDKIIDYCPFREVLYLTGKIDLTDKSIIDKIKNYALTICHEPFDFDYSNVIHTPSFIQNSYKTIGPDLQLLNKCKRNLGREIKKGIRRIGIHIRGGDYTNWENGKYFYNNAFWLSLVATLIKKNKNNPICVFVYDINQALIEKLKTLNVIIHQQSSPDEDFVRMMLMDEIWGPESTFTVVASDIAHNCLKRHVKINTLPPSNSENLQDFILNI